jgi:hypothetical protein
VEFARIKSEAAKAELAGNTAAAVAEPAEPAPEFVYNPWKLKALRHVDGQSLMPAHILVPKWGVVLC